MPGTQEFPLTNVPPVQGRPPAEDKRLLALARLAFRVGTRDEPLMQPATMVELFMDDFLSPVQQWCRSHAAKVAMCYISAYEDAPSVFVIGSAAGYDYSLSEPLASLEMDLHRRGLACSVLQLPPGNPHLLRAFIDESKAIRVCPQ